MEQARYWMWAKTAKPDSGSHILPPSSLAAMNSYGDSWEEQAFAEDAAGTLGGCVWPPRSYSCSFCRREFRSAQALGGHMNVHRRDRARLKQSPIPPSEAGVPSSHALKPIDPPYSSQMCTFLYNNPNPQFSDTRPIRVSSPPAAKVSSDQEKVSTLCFFSPLVQKSSKDSIVVSLHPPSWSSFIAERRDSATVLGAIKKNDEKISSTVVELDSRAAEKDDCVTRDLPVSLNLFFHGKRTSASINDEVPSCKRRRIEAKPLSSIPKFSAIDRCVAQSKECKMRSGAVEELDLELRLGDAPKVK